MRGQGVWGSHMGCCQADELYLNLVLEYIPETVFNITRHYLKAKQLPPLICVKVGHRVSRGRPAGVTRSVPSPQLYMYQLCRSLAYIHSKSICHRDIKPQNLLVDPSNHVLKLCDFGRSVWATVGFAIACSLVRVVRSPSAPRSWCLGSPMLPTFALASTAHRSSSSVPQTTPRRLVRPRFASRHAQHVCACVCAVS